MVLDDDKLVDEEPQDSDENQRKPGNISKFFKTCITLATKTILSICRIIFLYTANKAGKGAAAKVKSSKKKSVATEQNNKGQGLLQLEAGGKFFELLIYHDCFLCLFSIHIYIIYTLILDYVFSDEDVDMDCETDEVVKITTYGKDKYVHFGFQFL